MSGINCVYDSHKCLVCPSIAEVQATPATVTVQPVIGWNAGANSASALDGNMHVVFDMVLGISSTVVGFKYTRAQQDVPNLIEYGIYFQRVGGVDIYRVIERGVIKTSVRVRTGTELFEIARSGGNVVYLVNDVVFYRSQKRSTGAMLVNACLYTSGDAVGTAA